MIASFPFFCCFSKSFKERRRKRNKRKRRSTRRGNRGPILRRGSDKETMFVQLISIKISSRTSRDIRDFLDIFGNLKGVVFEEAGERGFGGEEGGAEGGVLGGEEDKGTPSLFFVLFCFGGKNVGERKKSVF